MTKQEMRLAIAKSLGWIHKDSTAESGDLDYWISPTGHAVIDLPNYPESLDACREFEPLMVGNSAYFAKLEALVWKKSQREVDIAFYGQLVSNVSRECVSATAEQKSIAYLKTKRLWRE